MSSQLAVYVIDKPMDGLITPLPPSRSFDHPNVGKLLGLVSQPPYYIAVELTVNGDLKTFLLAAAAPSSSTRHHDDESFKHAQSQVTTPQRVAMVTDAASGLAYLESLGYIHRDVAARNCMVTQHLGVKITGDGTSCRSSQL